jgi:RNA polymerase sigma-70 factor (ECF subfamily)
MSEISASSATDFPAAPGKEQSDDALLQQCRRGDQDAATQLYVRYVKRLRALAQAKCSTYLAQRVDADDIVQSVFRTFFRGVRQGYYDVPEGEDLWKLLLVIALNKIRAKGAYHQAAKRDVRLTETIDCSNPSVAECLGEDAFHQTFLKMVVEEALDQLDPRQREMVELRMQGHDIAEIAHMTGRSKRTVERNLQEVRRKLQGLLGEED